MLPENDRAPAAQAMLLVGTSAGLVAIYNIKAKQGTGDAGEDLELILSSVAWAGSSPVHLTTLWHPETAEVVWKPRWP